MLLGALNRPLRPIVRHLFGLSDCCFCFQQTTDMAYKHGELEIQKSTRSTSLSKYARQRLSVMVYLVELTF